MTMRIFLALLFPLSIMAQQPPYLSTLPTRAQQMFNESMTWLDRYYDPDAGYLYDVSAATALEHDTRSSAWYALGLLARSSSSDVQNAERIIQNVVSGQFKNPAEQWFGTYQKYPEEPYPGSPAYPAKIYDTWDPNWRGFVGTTFVMILEEFEPLLSEHTVRMIEESLRNATIGDSHRVGGVDGDNLYPAYSNPSLMRAFTTGWTGRRLKDANMTQAGEAYAQEVIDLFTRANTLSEFNSGTYTGVSLFALTLWAKYLPNTSVMNQYGPVMIRETWKSVSQLWHPELKNMAGPWDRSYGFDMNRYFSLMALHFWTLIGKDKSSLISKPEAMSHSADLGFAPLFAVLAEFHNALVPSEVLENLKGFSGEHTFKSSTFSPPYDSQPRNISAWLSSGISIGAESFNETVVGGPAENQDTFNPAVVQWDTKDGGVGFISLHPTETALNAVVNPYSLSLSYPYGNSSSIFSFIVSTFKSQPTVSGWKDLVGLSVNISGNIGNNYTVSFAGRNGGEDTPINDFEFWNFTYSVPESLQSSPMIILDLVLN